MDDKMDDTVGDAVGDTVGDTDSDKSDDTVEATMDEPTQEPLDQDKSADQLESGPNFVYKITNTVRNVANYLQVNGSRAFIWRGPAIEPGNDVDANNGTNQSAGDGPKAAKEEPDLLTTIIITQDQIDKRLQCTVCLDDYELNEIAMQLTCGHIFHEKCITHWIIMHGTCPVCRRYFCPGELHLPPEQVGRFRAIARRVYRTIRAPLVYFFPHLGRATVETFRNRPTPMYRLVRAERVTSQTPVEPGETESRQMIDDYIFCHVMFVLQNAQNEEYPGSPNEIAASMRQRFGRLHRPAGAAANAAAADGNPPRRERPEFQFPPDVLSAEYLGHY